jgi:hypothetical protein
VQWSGKTRLGVLPAHCVPLGHSPSLSDSVQGCSVRRTLVEGDAGAAIFLADTLTPSHVPGLGPTDIGEQRTLGFLWGLSQEPFPYHSRLQHPKPPALYLLNPISTSSWGAPTACLSGPGLRGPQTVPPISFPCSLAQWATAPAPQSPSGGPGIDLLLPHLPHLPSP